MPTDSQPDKLEPLFTEPEIQRRVSELAQEIAGDLHGRDVCVVAVLKGAFMLLADLLRRLHDLGVEPVVDFVKAGSYGSGDRSGGAVKITLDVSTDLVGKDVLLVDDIVDSGRTLSLLKAHLQAKGAASIRTVVLLDKPSRREVEFKPDYVGFEIPDRFVIGYGMDYAEKYRQLPYIAVVKTRG